MSLAARKNNIPTVDLGSISGASISGGEKTNGAYVDFVEFVIDSSLGVGVWPGNPNPGDMVLRTVEEVLGPDNFYAYYGWGDGTSDYSTSSGFEVLHTYDTQTNYTIRLLTNGYLSYGATNNRSGAGNVTEVNRFGEKTNWAGTISQFIAGSASPVTINPSDNAPLSLRSVPYMFSSAVNFNWGGFNQWDWTNPYLDSLSFFLGSTNYNLPITIVTSNIVSIDGALKDTPYDGSGMSGWDVSSITTFYNAFAGSDVDADLSSWDVSNVTSVNIALSNSSNFQGTGVDGWNVSSANNLSGAFLNCPLFTGDISGWTFKNGAQFSNIISECPLVTDAEVALFVEGWDSNPNQGTGCVSVGWCSLSGSPRTLSESTYPNAKVAHDNLKDSVANGGKGWVLVNDITWVA